MINKNVNKERALKLIEYADKYNLGEVKISLDKFLEINDNFTTHLLVIGGFSAGKSALLNKFIGKNILVESQNPETAFASELYFSENKKIIAHYNDKVIEINDNMVSNLIDHNITHLSYYIDSEKLKKYPDYIFVDTPGFDSGIERHNKALMQYIAKGTAYILVVDADKGTLSESTLRFIQELSYYSNDIGIIINKCDKKLESEIELIRTHIDELVFSYLGRKVPIITTSINSPNVVENISCLISEFDAQYLYEKNVTNELNIIKELLLDSINILKNNRTCDIKEIEIEISNRKQAKEKLILSIEDSKNDISTNVRTTMKEKIIKSIKKELVVNSDYLSKGLLISVDVLQDRIIEIIRPILMSEAEVYSTITTENIIETINITNINIGKDQLSLGDIVLSMHDKLKKMVDDGRLVFSNEMDKMIANKSSESSKLAKGKSLYRTISSVVAITTSAIAPILELLIVFLPDIVTLVQNLISDSPEEKALCVIKEEVIPQILSKLRTELDLPLAEIETSMIDNVITNINQLIEIENQALQLAIDDKERIINDFETENLDIESDLKMIMEI
ncbi:dynamin family protein [Veillonella atypica]|jgi:hypothetical protein|uniref:Dynamin family protein n=1 Tax=Veillonella atypica TaxID=39777 RepID=A0AAJ1Q9I5_9FIRM|nr:dynamin family protein [Veillonella atypica]MDK7357813.1 dynamin family protein [Veillonella atypica]